MAEAEVEPEVLESAGFEWDEEKNQSNLLKHRIAFEDACDIFYGPVIVSGSNRNNEERWIAVGKSHGRIVSVVFTRRNELIRIISARRARKNEERAYRNAKMGRPSEGKD
jgi:uncharacterized DUF497 family protein